MGVTLRLLFAVVSVVAAAVASHARAPSKCDIIVWGDWQDAKHHSETSLPAGVRQADLDLFTGSAGCTPIGARVTVCDHDSAPVVRFVNPPYEIFVSRTGDLQQPAVIYFFTKCRVPKPSGSLVVTPVWPEKETRFYA